MWVGEENTPRAAQIGVSAVDPASSFWNDLVHPPTETANGTKNDMNELLAKPKARAHSA
jgi:hypothetical protein